MLYKYKAMHGKNGTVACIQHIASVQSNSKTKY